MNIEQVITTAFGVSAESDMFPDEYIESNADVMGLPGSASLMEAVPAYMLWCVRNPDNQALVSDYIINALAEYGRSKEASDSQLNFRFLCDASQVLAVVEFLRWCSEAFPFADSHQLERALRQWELAANNSLQGTARSGRP